MRNLEQETVVEITEEVSDFELFDSDDSDGEPETILPDPTRPLRQSVIPTETLSRSQSQTTNDPLEESQGTPGSQVTRTSSFESQGTSGSQVTRTSSFESQGTSGS